MAKSTKTTSNTSRKNNSASNQQTGAKKGADSRSTSSSPADKKDKQQPNQHASKTTPSKKKSPPKRTVPSRPVTKKTKTSTSSKSTSAPAQTSRRAVQDAPQKSSNKDSNLRATQLGRTSAQRPEQRSQQNHPPQQWQSQNRPAPSQLPLYPQPRQEQKNELPIPPEKEINIKLDQSVAILIDGNNIEMSLHSVSKSTASMINFDKLIPTLLGNRALSRLIYFREGKSISPKLAERLQKMFHGSVVPCHKSADIPLSIKAVQVASKVDTIIILSGDADYVELVRHLKHDGIRVEIAAFPETTADILRQESDYFFPITVDYSFALK